MNKEYSKRLAKILYRSRYEAKLSQEDMALELGVSKGTIINWEKGVSSPSVIQSFKWFKIVEMNPLRPFLEFLYPNEYENLNPNDNDIKIQEAIHAFVNSMPIQSQRQLAFLFFGTHGSSLFPLLEMITAYLHLPLWNRTIIARLISESFDTCKNKNKLICNDNIMPNIDLLNKSIELSKSSEIAYSSNSIISDDKEKIIQP